MMMSASMGAMGISIGVAIDEGIGKDIHSVFQAAGFDFKQIVNTETQSCLAGTCSSDKKDKTLCRAETLLTINVYRYGFVTTSGYNDPIKPELDIGFKIGETGEQRLNLKDAELTAASIRWGFQKIIQKLAAVL